MEDHPGRGPRGHSAFIGLRDRQVVSISADSSHQDLARRLVIEGAVGTTGLAQALRHASENRLGLVRSLVDSDTVDPAVIPATVRAHVVSSLASLTHWRTGTFSVDTVDVLPDDVEVAFPWQNSAPTSCNCSSGGARPPIFWEGPQRSLVSTRVRSRAGYVGCTP